MPSLIQNTNVNQGFGSSPVVLTPGATTTAGHLLAVCAYYYDNPTAVTITDSSGTNTWVIGTTTTESQNPPVGNDSGDLFSAFVAWTFSIAAVTTVSVHYGNDSSNFGGVFTLSEWSGLAARTDSSAGHGASSTEILPPAVTLATSSDVVLGCGRQNFSGGSPVAPLTAFSSDGTGTTAYAQPGSAGSYTADWGGPANAWAAAVAVFTIPAGKGTLLSAWP